MTYADDSALLVPGSSAKEIENSLGSELESVSQWVHLGKTESILFWFKLSKSNTLKVICNGTEIVSNAIVTYLGLTFDKSLTGVYQMF